MSRPRPAALTRPFAALAAMTVAILVISRTTGSGWLVVVLSGLLAVLGLSAVLPGLALAGVTVEVAGPTDATAGGTVALTVTVGGRAGGGTMRLTGPRSDWVRFDGPGAGTVLARAARRGVLGAVEVELRSAAPFGLIWWRRRLLSPLAQPLEVGPAPVAAPAPPPEGTSGPPTAGRRSPPAHEEVRGLREYVPGDPPRLVSWVATARHGRLLVKELDGGAPPDQLTLVVDLRGGGPDAEVVASRAAGLALSALGVGRAVVLATAEAGGPRLGLVASAVQVSRRLARATADGPPAAPPPGVNHLLVRAGGP